MTIAQLVAAHIDEIRGKGHGELFFWARQHHLDTARRFGAFKRALLAHGINYNAMREAQARANAIHALATPTHTTTLFSCYDEKTRRFAIYDRGGRPLWCGINPGLPTKLDGQLDAALKAIWLAAKIRDAANIRYLRLTLIVDGQWLTSHAQPKQQSHRIDAVAARYGIHVTVTHLLENPVLRHAICANDKHWQDNDLKALATTISP